MIVKKRYIVVLTVFMVLVIGIMVFAAIRQEQRTDVESLKDPTEETIRPEFDSMMEMKWFLDGSSPIDTLEDHYYNDDIDWLYDAVNQALYPVAEMDEFKGQYYPGTRGVYLVYKDDGISYIFSYGFGGCDNCDAIDDPVFTGVQVGPYSVDFQRERGAYPTYLGHLSANGNCVKIIVVGEGLQSLSFEKFEFLSLSQMDRAYVWIHYPLLIVVFVILVLTGVFIWACLRRKVRRTSDAENGEQAEDDASGEKAKRRPVVILAVMLGAAVAGLAIWLYCFSGLYIGMSDKGYAKTICNEWRMDSGGYSFNKKWNGDGLLVHFEFTDRGYVIDELRFYPGFMADTSEESFDKVEEGMEVHEVVSILGMPDLAIRGTLIYEDDDGVKHGIYLMRDEADPDHWIVCHVH